MQKTERPPIGKTTGCTAPSRACRKRKLAEKIGVNAYQLSLFGNVNRHSAARRSPARPGTRRLRVSVEDLLGVKLRTKRAVAKGRAASCAVFEAASKLPRHQQQKILDFVEAFVAARHGQSKAA